MSCRKFKRSQGLDCEPFFNTYQLELAPAVAAIAKDNACMVTEQQFCAEEEYAAAHGGNVDCDGGRYFWSVDER